MHCRFVLLMLNALIFLAGASGNKRGHRAWGALWTWCTWCVWLQLLWQLILTKENLLISSLFPSCLIVTLIDLNVIVAFLFWFKKWLLQKKSCLQSMRLATDKKSNQLKIPLLLLCFFSDYFLKFTSPVTPRKKENHPKELTICYIVKKTNTRISFEGR